MIANGAITVALREYSMMSGDCRDHTSAVVVSAVNHECLRHGLSDLDTVVRGVQLYFHEIVHSQNAREGLPEGVVVKSSAAAGCQAQANHFSAAFRKNYFENVQGQGESERVDYIIVSS